MNSLWALGLLMVDSNSLWIRYVSMVVEVEGVTASEHTRLQNMSPDTQLLVGLLWVFLSHTFCIDYCTY
jgi:hypothetical protein